MMMNLMRRLLGRPSCGEIMEVLQSYLDGEIDADTARRVAAHLAECTDCDRESHVYESIKASLASRRTEVDPDIMAALHQFSEHLESAD